MGTTQPIRNRKELQKFSTYYQTVKPHPRNYALIILGLNTVSYTHLDVYKRQHTSGLSCGGTPY